VVLILATPGGRLSNWQAEVAFTDAQRLAVLRCRCSVSIPRP
jgi:hypothetical protein